MQRGVGAQLGELVGVLEQREQARREHRLGGVVAGGDELHEEAAELDVGHRAVAEVAGEDQRREVVARRLGAALRGELDRVHRHVDGARSSASSLLGASPTMSGSWPLVFVSAQALDLVPVLAREAHELADDLAGQQRGDVVHEVDVARFARAWP